MTTEVLTEQPPDAPIQSPARISVPPAVPGTAVAVYGDDHQRALEMRALKLALPGLRDASDAQVMALLVAGKQTGYSPLRGEIYLTDRGIQVASKVLASEAIESAAQRGDTLTITFEPIHEGMTEERARRNLEPGDVAVLVRIMSSKSRQAHYAERLARIAELRAIGYERDEIEQKLREEFPAPPVIESLGLVRAGEKFGRDGKPDAFPREERASKRGLKSALSKGGYMVAQSRLREVGVIVDDEPPTVIEPPCPAFTPDERHALNQRKLGRRELDESLV